MIQSNFRDWTLDKIDEAFGVEMVRQLPSLDTLLAFEYTADDYEKRYLNKIKDSYFWGGESWNEVELENKIISPLFVFADMGSKDFNYFLERDLKVTINEYELSGRVDGIVASGFRNPKKPYFCLNEYKKETDPNGDPKGQALIAMLAAQAINDNKNPIYGCYIVGRQWIFMSLEDKQYTFSNAFLVDSKEIFDIYRVLKGLRSLIQSYFV